MFTYKPNLSLGLFLTNTDFIPQLMNKRLHEGNMSDKPDIKTT